MYYKKILSIFLLLFISQLSCMNNSEQSSLIGAPTDTEKKWSIQMLLEKAQGNPVLKRHVLTYLDFYTPIFVKRASLEEQKRSGQLFTQAFYDLKKLNIKPAMNPDHRYTSIHEAAKACDRQGIIRFTQNGFNINIPDKTGNTALHYVCDYRDDELIIWLCQELGANPKLRDVSGVSALDILQCTGNPKLQQFYGLQTAKDAYRAYKNYQKETRGLQSNDVIINNFICKKVKSSDEESSDSESDEEPKEKKEKRR